MRTGQIRTAVSSELTSIPSGILGGMQGLRSVSAQSEVRRGRCEGRQAGREALTPGGAKAELLSGRIGLSVHRVHPSADQRDWE